MHSTQQYLPIQEIRDNIIITKDGGLHLVLLTSAINFALKSETEQNSIIFGFQNFINSLDFPIQIVVKSTRLDLDDYLNKLSNQQQAAPNELIRVQIAEYVGFVKRLISVANIMDKKFFIIISHYPLPSVQLGFFQKLFGIKSAAPSAPSKSSFDQIKSELIQKANVVASGLSSLGLRAVRLDTRELIELCYALYNPEAITKQKLLDISELTTEFIQKGTEE